MSQPLHVLLAEDNPQDAELVLRELRRAGFEPHWHRVDTEAAFLERLNPDLEIVISDFAMPQFNGLRALELVKQRGLEIPFIIVSGTIGEETAVAVMKEGATDYLLKDRLARLGPAVAQALEQARLRRERVAVAAALKRANDRYREIFEYAPAGILQTTPEGTIIAANPALARIFGYESADEFMRSGAGVLSHYVDATKRDELQRLLQQHGAVTDFEAQMRRKDGSVFWMSASVHVRRDEREGLHYDGTVEDVTERKRAEEIVQKAAGHLLHRRRKTVALDLAILAALTMLVYELARRFAWFESGTAWIAASNGLGFAQLDDIIVALCFLAVGLSIFAFRRWRESQSEVAIRQQTQEALRRLHAELETRVRQRTAELHKANDSLHTEVDERLRAEGELRLFRTLVDQSNDIFEVIDPETGRFLDVNESGCTVLGYSRAEFLSLRVFEIDPTVEPSNWAQTVAGIKATGSTSGEGIHRRKGGTAFPVEFNVKWVRLGRDYLVTVVRDVTERKKLEAQFLRAQRMEAIGTLASGVAHDLNNILAPMLMAAGLMKDKATAPRDQAMLTMIETSAQRGAGIIRQLLTFSRGISGERVSIQPKHLLKEMAQIMQETFPRNIAIEPDVPNNLWVVLADATQLHQVLLNLCVNARDAMPDGGRLTLGASNVQVSEAVVKPYPDGKPGPHVVVTVADTGDGIPPEILDRIFDPFFTTKGIGKGTGLGLSTVSGIVKSHGGFLTVASPPGRGTVFKVYLPATADAGDPDQPGTAVPTPRGREELILVVDDEVPILDATSRVLQDHGYHVLTAGNGEEAIKLFIQHHDSVRLVLTDVMMPVMGGVELIRALRVLAPNIRVVATSGLDHEDKRAELAALQVTEIVAKPFASSTLLQIVQRAMAGAVAEGRPDRR